MRTITQLEVQQRNDQRVNVYLDGKYGFSLQMIIAATLRLGQSLTDEQIAELEQRDAIENVYDRTLHYLSYRPRSQEEVKTYLLRRKVTEEVAGQVIERLLAAGLLDDRAFAAYWVDNREAFRPRGKHSLCFELRRKGVADAIIREVTQDLDEIESAYRAGSARASRLAGMDYQTFYRRLSAFLQRRGFNYNTVRTTVNHLWEDLQASEEERE